MRVPIETYRKFEIFFDTEEQGFCTVSNWFDAEQKKPSYASCKKWIDEFLKNNQKFTPFLVQENSSRALGPPKLVIGVRKDGKFIFEGGEQMSAYDEGNFVIFNEGNESINNQIQAISGQIEDLYEDIKLLKRRMKLVTVREHKKTLQT